MCAASAKEILSYPSKHGYTENRDIRRTYSFPALDGGLRLDAPPYAVPDSQSPRLLNCCAAAGGIRTRPQRRLFCSLAKRSVPLINLTPGGDGAPAGFFTAHGSATVQTLAQGTTIKLFAAGDRVSFEIPEVYRGRRYLLSMAFQFEALANVSFRMFEYPGKLISSTVEQTSYMKLSDGFYRYLLTVPFTANDTDKCIVSLEYAAALTTEYNPVFVKVYDLEPVYLKTQTLPAELTSLAFTGESSTLELSGVSIPDEFYGNCLQAFGCTLFQAGDSLFAYDGGDGLTALACGVLRCKRNLMFMEDGKVYLHDGSKYLVVDSGLFCDTVKPRIPKYVTEASALSETYTENEDLNILCDYFDYCFSFTSAQKFQTIQGLDVDLNDIELFSSQSYHYIDRSEVSVARLSPNVITIDLGSARTCSLVVRFKCSASLMAEKRAQLFGCTFSTGFGYSEAQRISCLLLAGNEDDRAAFYAVGIRGGEYFLNNRMVSVGGGGAVITGLQKFYNQAIVFTEHNTRLFQISNTAESLAFQMYDLHDSIGCDIPESIAAADNRIVFVNSMHGVCLIERMNTASTERKVKFVSANVLSGSADAPGLFNTEREELLRGVGGICGSRYLFAAGGRMWVWDYGAYIPSDSVSLREGRENTRWFYYELSQPRFFVFNPFCTAFACADSTGHLTICGLCRDTAYENRENALLSRFRTSSSLLGDGGVLKYPRELRLRLRTDPFGTYTVRLFYDGVEEAEDYVINGMGDKSTLCRLPLPPKQCARFAFELESSSPFCLEHAEVVYTAVV